MLAGYMPQGPFLTAATLPQLGKMAPYGYGTYTRIAAQPDGPSRLPNCKPKHLFIVETRLYCPQTLLYSDIQCRDNVSGLK